MGIFRVVAAFFGSLFGGGPASDSKTKSEIKRIEFELKAHEPIVYKGGMLLANLAEGFNLLYAHVKPIGDILSATIADEDMQRADTFAAKLFMTGFSPEMRQLYEQLSYENRKNAVREAGNESKAYEEQGRLFERLLKSLDQPEFRKIDAVINRLMQLFDICCFNYFSVVKLFDPDYVQGNPDYTPSFRNLPPSAVEVFSLDLYYLTADFQLTNTLAKAVVALAELNAPDPVDLDRDGIVFHLKKIAFVYRHLLSPDVLKNIVVISKKDTETVLQTASYNVNKLAGFIEHLKKQYELDKQRIKTELQNETITQELQNLFGSRKLESLNGYNAEQNTYLRTNGADPFLWIMPLEILKTFLTYFFDDKIKALLNDVVIEGFFNNPVYKSDFSSAVFSCTEASERIKGFEDSFLRGGSNDMAILYGYIRDSHKDPDFAKKLSQMISTINVEAKKLLQTEVNYLFALFRKLQDIFEDAKSANPSNISNIKILFSSTRNRETANLFENQYGDWQKFVAIMRNYVIIGEIGKS
ncbi:DUF5312 family protein [Treponema brennaborense]|uniref:Uncharacterized protein n=1 Tax=Treponema brennaborense (strain DSM 12168 / CIP 105900 / DD5/3) TaxID=906968 RepID=F4LM75_TREBD|nr:DUF5312 family protein [Treponema brennaborense]AEE17741.1 hypothetical protein Trebr_2332 [Treponema brennaborense DSM 12168]